MPSLTLRQRIRLRKSALRSAAVDRAVHAFARIRYALPDARPSRFDVEVVKDVVYGPTNHKDHRLDVYLPVRTRGPLPIVMYVHGGGFSMLSKETHFVMAMQFARRGYLVFNINYRQGLKWPYPAPLEDAAAALLWVHAHASEYGGDTSRVVLAGESAGGNLVTALALAVASRRPEPFAARVFDAGVGLRATISTYPYVDLASARAHFENPKLASWLKELLFDATCSYLGGETFYGHGAHAPLASPLTILESGEFRPERPLAPFFLSCGTRDPLFRDSKRLKAALDRLGVAAELFVAPGEIHGFDAMVWRPAARSKWRHAHAFLERHVPNARTAADERGIARAPVVSPGHGR